MGSKLFTFGLFILMALGVQAQYDAFHKKADSIAVLKQLNGFVEAFRDLDMERFESYFADEVTVFFPPSAMVPNRVDGKAKVMDIFRVFFQKAKKLKLHAPYLTISPKKMQLVIFQNIVIATFELDDTDSIGRRTIVLQKTNGKFLIIHLHASKIDNSN